MNSWNVIHEGNKYISPQIEPIFISYHLDNVENLTSNFLNNIKKYSPIGCRDLRTRDNLIKYKINAFFSSCLTTTLDIDYAISDIERSEEIIFIDYKIGDYPEADKFLLSLKAYNFNKTIHINHSFNLSLTHIERFRLAKKLLDKYARAKLIISTRIHGALPCLALNTPIIFINSKYDEKRFPGISYTF